MTRHSEILRCCLLSISILWASGCAILEGEVTGDVLIAISGSFEDDQIQVFLDEREIFIDTLKSLRPDESDFYWIPSAFVEETISLGNYELRIELNRNIVGTYRFNSVDVRYIEVYYDRETDTLQFTGYPEPIVLEG